LLAKNGGTINFNNPASITATGGAAINLENTAGTTGGVVGSGFTFLALSSVNSAGNGIRLNNLNGNLTVTGTTGISGATGASILITDTVTPPANDSILFNAVQVTNTVDPGDPTGTGSGRVYINGGTIVGSQDSIRLLASGDGVVNATAFTNRLDAPSNALNAIVQDAASSILLNASGNNSSTAGVPPGKFALDNSGRPQRTLFPRVHGARTSLPSQLRTLKMYKQLSPISKDKHARKKVKRIDSFDFASRFQLASIMAHEFTRAAAIYPIVFIKNKESNEPLPVVLMGLEENENLYVDAAGRWHASYIPAVIRRYPFALAATGQQDQFTVCIDEGSPLVTDEDGNALFDDKGEPTGVIENVKKYLGELQQMDTLTREFCRYILEQDLFTPLNMQVRQADTTRNIAGSMVINEQRLAQVSNEVFLEMRRRGYLPAIYAHLVSLGQVERLMMLKDERTTGIKGAAPKSLDTE
jgi:hypothetical protein